MEKLAIGGVSWGRGREKTGISSYSTSVPICTNAEIKCCSLCFSVLGRNRQSLQVVKEHLEANVISQNGH